MTYDKVFQSSVIWFANDKRAEIAFVRDSQAWSHRYYVVTVVCDGWVTSYRQFDKLCDVRQFLYAV